MTPLGISAGAVAGLALALGGCSVVGAAASVVGAAASVTGAVVVTGVKTTGKVIGAGIDVLTPSPAADHSGIVVRERIRSAEAPAASGQ